MSPEVDCVGFLQWALPRLGRRWAGYRKVRGQVCRRVRRRADALGLDSLADYRERLERDPDEWSELEPAMLRRAAEGRYPRSAVRELPGPWRDAAFARHGDELVLASRFRRHVVLARHDIRAQPPRGPFDLVLCRNLAFTYFDEAGQRETVRRLAGVTRSGAALVVGRHEDLPGGEAGFDPWAPRLGVFRRAG